MIENGVRRRPWKAQATNHEREPADEQEQHRGGAVPQPAAGGGARPPRPAARAHRLQDLARVNWACRVRPGSSPRLNPPSASHPRGRDGGQQGHHRDRCQRAEQPARGAQSLADGGLRGHPEAFAVEACPPPRSRCTTSIGPTSDRRGPCTARPTSPREQRPVPRRRPWSVPTPTQSTGLRSSRRASRGRARATTSGAGRRTVAPRDLYRALAQGVVLIGSSPA